MAATQDQTLFQPIDSTQDGKDVRYAVRRLTPVETERLQGFPDDHTNLAGFDPEEILSRMPQYANADEKGKKQLERKVRKWCQETPDGPRYKCTGNSFAVPVVRWIGERIQMVDSMLPDVEPLGPPEKRQIPAQKQVEEVPEQGTLF